MIIKNGKRIDGCSDTLPVGTVQPFLGLTPPKGYLLCQGQAVNKITYAELYEICGDAFGQSTATEFYLPDLRGKTIAGYDSSDTAMNTIGKLLGNKTHTHTSAAHTHTIVGHVHTTGNHTLTVDEIPSHAHYGVRRQGVGTSGSGSTGASSSSANTDYYTDYTGGSGAHNHGDTGSTSLTTDSTTPDNTGSNTNFQPTIVMNWIVKAIMTIPVQTSVATSYTDSETDVYSCDYINETLQNELGDRLPEGSIIEYNGTVVPEGYEAVSEDIGRIYITSTNENPSSYLGGTWELIDKEFSNYQNLYSDATDIAKYVTAYEDNVNVSEVVVRRIGHSINLRIAFSNLVELTDTGITLMQLNLEALGVEGLSYTQHGVIVGADGGNAVINLSIYDDGNINCQDVMVRGNSSASLPTGSSPRLFYKQDVWYNNMLDEVCDKFYWKRTA